VSCAVIEYYGDFAPGMVDAPSTVYGVPSRSTRNGKVIVKKIEAVFLPFKLDDVRDVLVENNVREFIVTEINAHEVERAPAERWGRQNLTDLAPRLKLEMAISDRDATAIAYAILRAARTRRPEDTNVTIALVEQLVEIETGELVTDVPAGPLAAVQHA
jgi:nitrogen regulatory protein PII